MENPLRIPSSYLECGRIQQQISWTTITGHKTRRQDSKHNNGAVLFDHNHAALVRLGLSERKPCLILTDVLKTDAGKAYMERIKRHVNGKERGRTTDLPMVSRSRRSSCTKNTHTKSSVSPKSKTTPDSTILRSRSRSTTKSETEELENAQDENDDVVSGKNGFDLVDCGLSVMWEDKSDCKSPATKIKSTEEKKGSQKRKVSDDVCQSTETDTPKRPRASVLRLTSAVDTEEATVSPEKGAENKDSKGTEEAILQFTVGEDDKAAEAVVPVSQDNDATIATAEPIVLSSDDEDSGAKADAKRVSSKRISQPPPLPQLKALPLMELQPFDVFVNEDSDSAKGSCLCYAFSDLYSGPHHVKANGDILITDDNFIIPLKDASEEMDLMITLERKHLRRYSVWEKKELETLKYYSHKNKSEIPAVGLLFCVSEEAAEGIQYDLNNLCGSMATGKPSPFILIYLQESLEGMEGAFLRSLLDMDCLNSLSQRKTLGDYDQAAIGPSLSLDQCVDLITSSDLDPHLLQFLDQGSECAEADCGKENTLGIALPTAQSKETVLEKEKTAVSEKSTPTEADKLQQSLTVPPEKKVLDPVYTLCHRQLEDSYSVTMCRPGSGWVKYKHQGLARRLIQFPPPPMKGGITVSMEDLLCLDIGQYLNDVIIDFYLKYLLQNASESVAMRSHIFSSFFYKQLTRRDNASEGSNNESCQRQKRYQRVRTWTRHVDIFSKDFIFVPVNQEAHWYLVVICFPGLEEPKNESLSQSPDEEQASESPNRNPEDILHNAKEDPTNNALPGPVNCTEQTCRRMTVCKRPCILVMDSLKRPPPERIIKLLREYLQCEWEARRGSSREFGAEQMESAHCQVPLQDNSSDCGLYLLHYVESFLKDPIVHFELPLHLKFWFPRRQIRRKREEIRDLVLKLYRIQNMNVTT
ncbi:unnamed protein product [Knipowitschia caucasica]